MLVNSEPLPLNDPEKDPVTPAVSTKSTLAVELDTVKEPVIDAAPSNFPFQTVVEVIPVNPDPSPTNPVVDSILPETTTPLLNICSLAMFYFIYTCFLNAVIIIFTS